MRALAVHAGTIQLEVCLQLLYGQVVMQVLTVGLLSEAPSVHGLLRSFAVLLAVLM